jgi:hypothetical protein
MELAIVISIILVYNKHIRVILHAPPETVEEPYNFHLILHIFKLQRAIVLNK